LPGLTADAIDVDKLGPKREAVPFVEEHLPAEKSFDVMMTTLAGLVLNAEARGIRQGCPPFPVLHGAGGTANLGQISRRVKSLSRQAGALGIRRSTCAGGAPK
jgi:hypothetical protein